MLTSNFDNAYQRAMRYVIDDYAVYVVKKQIYTERCKAIRKIKIF